MAAFDLPSDPGFRVNNWRLAENRAAMTSGISKMTQYSVREGAKWMCEIELPPLDDRETAQAWLAAMIRGIREPFYLTPPYADAPLSGGTPGTLLVDGAGQTGRTLNVKGGAAGYALKAGDYLSFPDSVMHQLHMLRAPVTLDAFGEGALLLQFPIRRSPATDAAITLHNPKGEFTLAAPEAGYSADHMRFFRTSFAAEEWVR